MNPWINYHHLYYFKTIAEEGSVSRAAIKLRLGQPTISAQLKQFETALGVQLFERQHKKLILTEQGRIALDYARSIFKLGSEMFEVLHDQLKPLKPSVTIGALDSVPKQIILQMVKATLKLSRCHITLVEGKADELLRELSSHRIDICLTNFLPTATDAKGLFHRVITKRNVSIFASPKFKHLRKNFPKSISGQPMILPSYDSKLRYDLDHWSQAQGVEFDVITESQDIAVKKLMAVSELGLIATASHTVTRQVLAGELIEIGPLHGVYEELLLISAQRRIENPLAKELMKSFTI
jgi:LysR family transcriptional activator of nhaA